MGNSRLDSVTATASSWFANGTTLDHWNHTLQGGFCATGNRYYLGAAGRLNLTTNGQTANCAEITSPFLSGPGTYEGSIYLWPAPNGGVADWPAFWLSGPFWPRHGEIDIAEGLGGSICATYHYNANGPTGSFSPTSTSPQCSKIMVPGWHYFKVVWKAGSLVFFYDGKQAASITGSFVQAFPMNVLLDETEGRFGNQPGVPSDMRINWVRYAP